MTGRIKFSIAYGLWLGLLSGFMWLAPSPMMDGYGKAIIGLLFLPLLTFGPAAFISGDLK